MHIYYTFILFLSGLVTASFLNALLYRIDNGYKYPDIFIKGSHCEKCGKLLKTYELIPILSYIIFRGKCSKCGYGVPSYYPISELMLGLSFAGIYYYSLPFVLYIVVLFFFSFSYFDRISKSIPAIIVDVYLILSVLYFFIIILIEKYIPDNALILGISISLSAFLVGKFLKKPFGLGDILVLLGLSILLNIQNYLIFIYLFLFISIAYSVILIVFKKANLRTSLPLLPFMFVSLSLLLFFNEYLVNLIEKIYYF